MLQYITHSRTNGTRTIQHFRELAELQARTVCQAIEQEAWDWIHFECRNLQALESMMTMAAAHHRCCVSLEIESTRHDWNTVLQTYVS